MSSTNWKIYDFSVSFTSMTMEYWDKKLSLFSALSDISHQLKTPLAALTMYQEIIADEPEHPDTVRVFSAKMSVSLRRKVCQQKKFICNGPVVIQPVAGAGYVNDLAAVDEAREASLP